MLTRFWVLGLIPAALSITYKQNTVLVYEMLVVVLVAVDVCQLALWSFFQQCWDVTHASGRQTTMPLIYLVNNVVMGLKFLCVILVTVKQIISIMLSHPS